MTRLHLIEETKSAAIGSVGDRRGHAADACVMLEPKVFAAPVPVIAHHRIGNAATGDAQRLAGIAHKLCGFDREAHGFRHRGGGKCIDARLARISAELWNLGSQNLFAVSAEGQTAFLCALFQSSPHRWRQSQVEYFRCFRHDSQTPPNIIHPTPINHVGQYTTVGDFGTRVFCSNVQQRDIAPLRAGRMARESTDDPLHQNFLKVRESEADALLTDRRLALANRGHPTRACVNTGKTAQPIDATGVVGQFAKSPAFRRNGGRLRFGINLEKAI
jgi:hypothetical protein